MRIQYFLYTPGRVLEMPQMLGFTFFPDLNGNIRRVYGMGFDPFNTVMLLYSHIMDQFMINFYNNLEL